MSSTLNHTTDVPFATGQQDDGADGLKFITLFKGLAESTIRFALCTYALAATAAFTTSSRIRLS